MNGDIFVLRVITSVSQLNIDELLAIYREESMCNGALRYPHCAPAQQLLKAENEFIGYISEVFFRASGAFYALWIENGHYCAALRMEAYRDGLLLESLETKHELRRRGYAHKLLTASLEYAASLGFAGVYSHVDKRNVPSLRAHEKAGFQRISESAAYIDGTVTQKSCTFYFDLK